MDFHVLMKLMFLCHIASAATPSNSLSGKDGAELGKRFDKNFTFRPSTIFPKSVNGFDGVASYGVLIEAHAINNFIKKYYLTLFALVDII